MEVIHRESSFPKAFMAQVQASVRIGTRFAYFDRSHSIGRRADKRIEGAPMIWLQRTNSPAGHIIKPSLFAHNNSAVLPGPSLCGFTKQEAAKKHLAACPTPPSWRTRTDLMTNSVTWVEGQSLSTKHVLPGLMGASLMGRYTTRRQMGLWGAQARQRTDLG